jgi:hypothetical protein
MFRFGIQALRLVNLGRVIVSAEARHDVLSPARAIFKYGPFKWRRTFSQLKLMAANVHQTAQSGFGAGTNELYDRYQERLVFCVL